MFIIIFKEVDRHSNMAIQRLLGEFETPEQADAAIVAAAKASKFYKSGDGTGTYFCRVDPADYVKVGGEIYVRVGAYDYTDYPTPEEVREDLEPY